MSYKHSIIIIVFFKGMGQRGNRDRVGTVFGDTEEGGNTLFLTRNLKGPCSTRIAARVGRKTVDEMTLQHGCLDRL